MERRKFLKIGGGAALAGAGLSPFYGRLYGAPNYLTDQGEVGDLLTLQLDKMSIPSGLWTTIRGLSTLLGRVFTDSQAATAFLSRDPAIFDEAGIEFSGDLYSTFEFRLISAALEPETTQIADTGDFEALLNRLTSVGLIDALETSILDEKLEELLSEKRELLNTLEANLGNEEFSDIVGRLADPPINGPVLGVNLVAVINLGVLINAAAWILVYAWIHGPSASGCQHPPCPQPRSNLVIKLDPDLVSSYEVALEVARLTGQQRIVEDAFGHLLKVEAEALTQAFDRVLLTPRNLSSEKNLADVRYVIEQSLGKMYGIC